MDNNDKINTRTCFKNSFIRVLKIILSLLRNRKKHAINYIINKLKNHLPPNQEDDFSKTFTPLLDISVKLSLLNKLEQNNKLADKKISQQFDDRDFTHLRIAGFGTDDDWRRNGIWAACRRKTDFQLFEVPDGTYPNCGNEDQEREAKKRNFLSFIKELNSRKPVNMALFSHSGRHISSELLEELNSMGILTVIMSVDDKHQFLYPLDKNGLSHQLRVAGKANNYWTNWEGAIPIISSHGGNPWFAPPGADPNIFYPTGKSKELDIVFVGGCYGVRKELVNKLQRWFRIEAYGDGWPHGTISYTEMIELYGKSKIVLGISGVGSSLTVQTLKGRDFEVPMSGAAYLTTYNSEYAKCFKIGEEVSCYGSIEDCVEEVNWLLKEPGRTEDIGMRGRERSVRDHTWDKRLNDLLKICYP